MSGIPHLAKNERDVGHPAFVTQKSAVSRAIFASRQSIARPS
jgi:hypothetical protein